MPLTTTPPPNDLHALIQDSPVASGHTRRLLQTAAYIVLMLLLLLYLLYGGHQWPVSKRKPTKKPWSISQGFLLRYNPGTSPVAATQSKQSTGARFLRTEAA